MLIKLWGAEKVAKTFVDMFPEADFFTLIYDEKKVWKIFPKKSIHASCLSLRSQKIYNFTKKQRFCLPFMISSIESLDFSDYDLVIVSSSWFAHGLKTRENTKTLIYYHAPARYMWDWTHEYRKELGLYKWFLWYVYGRLLLKLRSWDYYASQKNTTIIANSYTTQKRISKYYRIPSKVIFPPIETKRFAEKVKESSREWNYYIILSALTEFKRLDVAIKSWKKINDVKLLVIWEGEYRKKLEEIAHGDTNIEFLGAKYGKELVEIVGNSLWLIFPGEEDFWIVPIEVMAAWKPVFALERWWLTETVLPWVTGEFFTDPEGADFAEKFHVFHKNNTKEKYKESACKKRSQEYDTLQFEKQILSLI